MAVVQMSKDWRITLFKIEIAEETTLLQVIINLITVLQFSSQLNLDNLVYVFVCAKM